MRHTQWLRIVLRETAYKGGVRDPAFADAAILEELIRRAPSLIRILDLAEGRNDLDLHRDDLSADRLGPAVPAEGDLTDAQRVNWLVALARLY